MAGAHAEMREIRLQHSTSTCSTTRSTMASSSTAPSNNAPSLAPPARARLQRELSRLTNDPPPGIAAYAPNPADPSYLRAQITGPPNTPYSGGIFLVTLRFTARYPFEPPRVRFVTQVYHPNIDSGGRICLDTLKQPPAGSWSPAVSLPSLLTTLRALLADPNPDDALVAEIAEEFKMKRRDFERKARERTGREATGERCERLERELEGVGDQKEEEKKREGSAAATTAAGAPKNADSGDAADATNSASGGPRKENSAAADPTVKSGDSSKADAATATTSKKAGLAASSASVNTAEPDASADDSKKISVAADAKEEGGGKRQKVEA